MNPDRIADAAASSTVLLPTVSVIAQLNDYLQAGAFIVAIISGLCAARYYWKKAHNK
jgi:hypothetical protein